MRSFHGTKSWYYIIIVFRNIFFFIYFSFLYLLPLFPRQLFPRVKLIITIIIISLLFLLGFHPFKDILGVYAGTFIIFHKCRTCNWSRLPFDVVFFLYFIFFSFWYAEYQLLKLMQLKCLLQIFFCTSKLIYIFFLSNFFTVQYIWRILFIIFGIYQISANPCNMRPHVLVNVIYYFLSFVFSIFYSRFCILVVFLFPFLFKYTFCLSNLLF